MNPTNAVTSELCNVFKDCNNEAFIEGMYESMNVQHILVQSAGGRQLDTFVTLIHPTFKKRENFTEVEDHLFKDVDDRDIPDSIDAHALIDLGCTGSCIDSGFVKNCSIPTT